MATTDDVADFYTRWGYTVRHDGDAAGRAAGRSPRAQVGAFWDVARDQAPPLLNAMLAQGGAVPRLVRHGDMDWHVHGTLPDAPLGTVVLVETAMAIIDVVRSDEYDRL